MRFVLVFSAVLKTERTLRFLRFLPMMTDSVAADARVRKIRLDGGSVLVHPSLQTGLVVGFGKLEWTPKWLFVLAFRFFVLLSWAVDAHKIGRTRRLVYCFSKRFDHHVAAVALGYVWYNLGWIVKGLRMTPGMAVGATEHLWTIEEFHDVITDLARGEPVAKPEKQPLAHQTPEGPARELPNGRGFLRVVQGGGEAPAAPHAPPPVASVAPVPAAAALRFDETGQADLFSWTAPKREPQQLSLFD